MKLYDTRRRVHVAFFLLVYFRNPSQQRNINICKIFFKYFSYLFLSSVSMGQLIEGYNYLHHRKFCIFLDSFFFCYYFFIVLIIFSNTKNNENEKKSGSRRKRSENTVYSIFGGAINCILRLIDQWRQEMKYFSNIL